MKKLVFSILMLLTLSKSVFAFNHKNFIKVSNDILGYGSLVYGAAYTWKKQDKEGFYMLAESGTLTMLSVTVLKNVIDRKRPDYKNGDKKDSFPSGHTASAFALASFVDRRYGFKEAIPYYLTASYVGWARVYLDRHHPSDVFAGAALAYASSYFIVSKRIQGKQISFNPIIEPNYKGFILNMNF